MWKFFFCHSFHFIHSTLTTIQKLTTKKVLIDIMLIDDDDDEWMDGQRILLRKNINFQKKKKLTKFNGEIFPVNKISENFFFLSHLYCDMIQKIDNSLIRIIKTIIKLNFMVNLLFCFCFCFSFTKNTHRKKAEREKPTVYSGWILLMLIIH